MKTLRKYHKLWCRTVAVVAVSLFGVSAAAWPFPAENMVAVQSVFQPLEKTEIRDIAVIKYLIMSVSRIFPDLNAINSDINAKIGADAIDVSIKFSQKGEKYLPDPAPEEERYLVPAVINGAEYYAYVTAKKGRGIDRITVFTWEEFKRFEERHALSHGARAAYEEKEITHEQDIDTPLSIIHGGGVGINAVAREIKEEVLEFFRAMKASGDFIRKAADFLFKEGAVTLVPRRHDLAVELSEDGAKREYRIPIEITTAHASNNYINIPEEVFPDIGEVLVHEIGAKTGSPHFLNVELGEAYKGWREMRRTKKAMDPKMEYPRIAGMIALMRFKDLKEVEGRDLNADGDAASGPNDQGPGRGEKKKRERSIEEKLGWGMLLKAMMDDVIRNIADQPPDVIRRVFLEFMDDAEAPSIERKEDAFKTAGKIISNADKAGMLDKVFTDDLIAEADRRLRGLVFGDDGTAEGAIELLGRIPYSAPEASSNLQVLELVASDPARSASLVEKARATADMLIRLEPLGRLRERAAGASRDSVFSIINIAIAFADEKVIIALDDTLGRTSEILKIIKTMEELDETRAIKQALKNVTIVSGRGIALVRKVEGYIEAGAGEKSKKPKVIMIADVSTRASCSPALLDGAIATFVDDKAISANEHYYPLVDIVLFTLVKALNERNIVGYDKIRLKTLFEKINADVTDARSIYDRVTIITLKPAEKFDYSKELRDVYLAIRNAIGGAA